MAGTASEEFGVGRSMEGNSTGQQRYPSTDAIVEWRSSEQLEIGTPSTSPPYWDSDDEEDSGPKPSELYGKYTWKIDKFSQINKRELRSNPFEVGGYKWYILIYPQGCDVCNHLSLFLCVANHDKLLPGWSHFAQFTIAVVNKDPKKSKYSDTLHRFWKKEHDWGWKKFMELSKVLDGFIDADTLIIKAQVQVIRERADRPFRCLDCNYRRELIRVYLTNVEQICRRFVEERRGKLGKLIEDKVRWTSFCTFWLGMDQSARRAMSWEKTDSILKIVAKHFFIEKEVTSTLVMDSLYSGMKALEGQGEKSKGKQGDLEEPSVPIVRAEKDMFVLVDDVLLLLERAALEPLPPKDEKGPQNRTKDGSSGEDFNKDSIERDERRLTELGRRTIEIFVLSHIFSKIEVAYQEAVALKRQEELIREEEAAWLAESEQKSRRGAVDKEKKSKKKQGKQKRNNRKTKDKGKDEKHVMVQAELAKINDEMNNFTEEPAGVAEKVDVVEDVSDLSDSVDCIPEVHSDVGDRNLIAGNWDTDASDLHPSVEDISSPSALQNGPGEISVSGVDDSSSTCSTDSVPSVVNGFNKGNTSFHKKQKSPIRWHERGKSVVADWSNGYCSQPSESMSDVGNLNEMSKSSKATDINSQAALCSSEDQVKESTQLESKKGVEIASSRTILGVREEREVERNFSEKALPLPSQPRCPTKNYFSLAQLKSEAEKLKDSLKTASVGRLSGSQKQADESSQGCHPSEVAVLSRPGTCKPASSDPIESTSTRPENPSKQQAPISAGKQSSHQVLVNTETASTQPMSVPAEKPSTQQVAVMSRPSSSNLVPGSRPSTPAISMVQTPHLLSRSSSSAGWLGPVSSPATSHNYVPQSYRNVMMGNTVNVCSMGLAQSLSSSSGLHSSHPVPQSPALFTKPLFTSQSSEGVEVVNANNSNFPFGMVKQEMMPDGQHWIEARQMDDASNVSRDHLSSNEMRNIDAYKQMSSRPHDLVPAEYPACTSGRASRGLADEFPHMGIINDLLEDDAMGRAGVIDSSFHTYNSGPQHIHRQFSFPNDIGMSSEMGPSTSSCRFERTLSYHDGLHRTYTSPAVPYETLRDMASQPHYQPYANGHIDLLPNQWHMGGSERPYLNPREMNNDGYPYHNPPAEFHNMAGGRPNFSGFYPNGN